ncbi:hypothetical protein D3C76_995510 [compost metagenome]
MNNLIGFRVELGNNVQLLLGVVARVVLPFFRDNWQVFDTPDFFPILRARCVCGSVSIGVGLLQHVPEKPGHYVRTALDVAPALPGLAQLGGDCFCYGWFLCDE